MRIKANTTKNQLIIILQTDLSVTKCIKGEVHPKMIKFISGSVHGAESNGKVRGAYDKPFWIYKRLNNCAAPTSDSDDVLVVEEEVFLCAGHAKEATTKTSSLSGAGAAQLFNRLYIQNG